MLLIKTQRIIQTENDDCSITLKTIYKLFGIPILNSERVLVVLPAGDLALNAFMAQRKPQKTGKAKG
jgi:hypothetical protein